MIKQQEVIVESIYQLGKLVNPKLDMREVKRILRVNVHKEEVVDLSKKEFTFTGKRLSDNESLLKNPEVTVEELDGRLQVRECHLDDTYKFSEDGRVYDEFLQGYIKPVLENNPPTVQVMLDRTVVNVPEDFVRYYAITKDTEQANKLVDEALLTIRSNSDKEESKRQEQERNLIMKKERESQSERYNYHTKTHGMYLPHTPYVLTEEGRVYDSELGSLRAVNNRGYTTNLAKGFKIPVNISINNIKNILENQDFTILIERAGYTKAQCEDMWEDYQKRMNLKEEKSVREDRTIKQGTDIDAVAEKAGFIKTEDGYYIHKSQV